MMMMKMVGWLVGWLLDDLKLSSPEMHFSEDISRRQVLKQLSKVYGFKERRNEERKSLAALFIICQCERIRRAWICV